MDNMSENIETLLYEIGLRARLFRTSKGAKNHGVVLTPRERLLVELIGIRDNMSISEISQLCPAVSNSTISTTITRLWKDRKLVEKRILPENQRITNVSLTVEGRRVLNAIKVCESGVYKKIAESRNINIISKEKPRLMDVHKLYSNKLYNERYINFIKIRKNSPDDILKIRKFKNDGKKTNNHRNIINMAEMGMTPAEIAKKVDRPLGEIELVMKMNH